LSKNTDTTVPFDRLGALGAPLSRGGQATVFELPHFTVPDARGELVYKQYHQPPTSAADLWKIVALRDGLEPAVRARLDAIASWPCRVVTLPDGTVNGVVLPRIEKSYMDTLTLPSGRTKPSPREVLNLFVPADRMGSVGRPVPTGEERLAVCRDFAAGLSFLHERLGIVFGDVNAKNELWRLGERPMVMFLDCDAVRPRGSVAATKQLNAPDWDPPERTALNRTTDLYKLGLFVLRALTPAKQASTRRDPAAAAGVLDGAGLDLLSRAVGPVPQARPSAWDWTVYLSRLLGDPVAPPSLDVVSLDRRVVLTGHPVEVRWRATGAVWLDIVVPGGVVRVDGRQGTGAASIVPSHTGPVVVRVGNDYGTAERPLGTVTVAAMPVQRPIDVPMPSLGWDRLRVPRLPGLPVPPLPVIGTGLTVPDPGELMPDGGRRRPIPLPNPTMAGCPLDLVGMVTDTPEIDSLPRFER
jgi:hypothetical protein